MKRKKCRLTIVISIFLVIGPTACFIFEECPKAFPYFTIHGLEIYNLTFTGKGLNPWRVVKENEPIKYDSFFIRIGFEKTFYSKLKFSNGNNLFALSCVENGYAGSQVGIDTIYLVTMQDYNNEYFENDTINRILLANYWTFRTEDFSNYFPLSRYINENRDGIRQDVFEIKIIEPPLDQSNEYQFRLIFILQNGERFERTSNYVTLVK